jgi:hypothetical protein
LRCEMTARTLGLAEISSLTSLWQPKKRVLKGFTAHVVVDNWLTIHLFRSFESRKYKITRRIDGGVFHLKMEFPEEGAWIQVATDYPFGLEGKLRSDCHSKAEVILPNNT